MAVAANPQTELGERVIENAELEAALERRELAKAARAEATRTFKAADDAAKARMVDLELDESPARCGRFVIRQSDVAGRSVAFGVSESR